AAVALRGLQIPLSKYSYLTQTGLAALTGSLLAGVPATALAIALSVLIADWLWHKKMFTAALVNLGREVLALVGAYGVYAFIARATLVGTVVFWPPEVWLIVAALLTFLGLLFKTMLEEAISAEELNKIHAVEAVITSNISLEDSFARIERLAHRLVDWGDFRI